MLCSLTKGGSFVDAIIKLSKVSSDSSVSTTVQADKTHLVIWPVQYVAGCVISTLPHDVSQETFVVDFWLWKMQLWIFLFYEIPHLYEILNYEKAGHTTGL